jgi:hypothetical protein
LFDPFPLLTEWNKKYELQHDHYDCGIGYETENTKVKVVESDEIKIIETPANKLSKKDRENRANRFSQKKRVTVKSI